VIDTFPARVRGRTLVAAGRLADTADAVATKPAFVWRADESPAARALVAEIAAARRRRPRRLESGVASVHVAL
jgi:hypothetical protein